MRSVAVLVLLGLSLLVGCTTGPAEAVATATTEVKGTETATAGASSTASSTASPTASSTASSTQTPQRTASATISASSSPIPTAPLAVIDLNNFITDYGYPSTATYAQIKIERIGVNAFVSARVVDHGQPMPDPYGPADVIWYDLSAWGGTLGGSPGVGNSIFAGHYDYAAWVPYAGVRYGPAWSVFVNLRNLIVGDMIEIDKDNVNYRYAVSQVWNVGPEKGAEFWERMWSSDVLVDSVTLYTCGGVFDKTTGEYPRRTVVRAERVSE